MKIKLRKCCVNLHATAPFLRLRGNEKCCALEAPRERASNIGDTSASVNKLFTESASYKAGKVILLLEKLQYVCEVFIRLPIYPLTTNQPRKPIYTSTQPFERFLIIQKSRILHNLTTERYIQGEKREKNFP